MSKSKAVGPRLPDPAIKKPFDYFKTAFFAKTTTGRKLTNEIISAYVAAFFATSLGAYLFETQKALSVSSFFIAGMLIAFTFPKADRNIQAGYFPLLHKILFALSSIGEFLATVLMVYSILL